MAASNPAPPPGDEGKADPARKDLPLRRQPPARRFHQRATPEYRAKAGITQEEWDRLLSKAAEYDALLNKMQKQVRKTAPDGRTTGNGFGSSGPSTVVGSQSAADPQSGGQAQTAPELLDPARRFRDR